MYSLSFYFLDAPDWEFDLSFYVNKHVPMISRSLADNFIRSELHKGHGVSRGQETIFRLACHFYVKSVEDLHEVLADKLPDFIDSRAFTNSAVRFHINELLE